MLVLDQRLSGRFAFARVKIIATPLLSNGVTAPIFPSRISGLVRQAEGWRGEFIGRIVDFGPEIDWRAPGTEPRDQLWCMNLHYMEYLEAASDDDLRSLIDGWIDGNPSYCPGWWKDSWNSYALSLRVVVWMQQLALRRERFSAAFLDRVHGSLAFQLRFLCRRLETDLGGNHLIKNIKALLWAGEYFSGAQADYWRTTGLRLLKQALKRQVLPDGVHFERSPSYHAQVFADLLECRTVLGRYGGDQVEVLNKILVAMAQATADLAHPDGAVAQFNDSGLNMAYLPVQCLQVFEKTVGQRSPEPRPVFSLPAAGYFGMRTSQMYLVVDCGPIGPDDLPAHAHGDILSLELSAGGLRFVVDPGVFEYVAGEKRLASRSAMSHNTLCLQGEDQAEFYGAFRCGRRPDVRVRMWTVGEDDFVLEGDHDGFAHLPGTPMHVRRITAGSREVMIEDWIEGQSDRPALIGFLLHPDVSIEMVDGGLDLCREAVRLRLISDMQPSIERAVWWPDMGTEYPTRRLRFRVPPHSKNMAIRMTLV